MLDRNKLFQALILLLSKWKLLLINFIVVSIIAVTYSLFLKKAYQSTLTFLPPVSRGLGGIPGFISGLSGDILLRNDLSTEQLFTILGTRHLRERILDEFNLIEYFKLQNSKNKRLLALKSLENILFITAEQNQSIQGFSTHSISIQALHASPDTAYIMAEFVFQLLDSTVNAINTANAARTRSFVEKRLYIEDTALDSLQKALELFQTENHFYDAERQGEMVIKSLAEIKTQIVSLEIRRDLLLLDRSGSNPSVVRMQNEIDALENKLEEITERESPDLLTGLKKIPTLSAQYGKLMLEIKLKTQIIMFLSQQLEQEKVIENRNVSYLSVIDPPVIAEYKFKPKRAIIVLLIVVPECLLLMILLVARDRYQSSWRNSNAVRRIKKAFRGH